MEKTFSEVFGILKDINDLENSTEILNLDRSDDEVWEILHSEKHDSVISIGQFWDKSKTKDYLLKILSVDPRDMVCILVGQCHSFFDPLGRSIQGRC